MYIDLNTYEVKTYKDISWVRHKYSEYDDLSAEELARRIHLKYLTNEISLYEYRKIFLSGPDLIPQSSGSFEILRSEKDELHISQEFYEPAVNYKAIKNGLANYSKRSNTVQYKYIFTLSVILFFVGLGLVILSRRS
jgi:hypothetical protein